MIIHLHKALSQLVGVDVEEALEQLVRNAHVRVTDIFERVQQDLVSSFVVSKILLLSRNVNCNSHCLLNVTDCSVKLKGPLGLLGDFVSLTHQVVYELMSKRIELDLGDHFNHRRNHGFTFGHVQLESLAVLFSPVVMTSGFAPLGFTFVELGNLKVLIDISIVVFQYNLSVLVHLLMRLGNDEGIFTLATQNQELNSFLLGAFSLAELCNLEGALGQLALLSEDGFSPLSIIQVVQIKSDNIFPIVGTFVSLFSLTVELF